MTARERASSVLQELDVAEPATIRLPALGEPCEPVGCGHHVVVDEGDDVRVAQLVEHPVPRHRGAGPGPQDPSSVVWLYHAHVNSPQDINTGLVGALIITRHGEARPDGSPRDVDREFVTLFMNFDEAQSRFSLRNAALLASGPTAASLNRFHSINGYVFGNLPMLRMKAGERVRWYLVALGDSTDVHTPHWHGNTVLHEGRRTDVVELLPASMKVADMHADNPGIWLYHCHVDDHVKAGMVGRYEIEK